MYVVIILEEARDDLISVVAHLSLASTTEPPRKD
jgi:hypothetical protein